MSHILILAQVAQAAPPPQPTATDAIVQLVTLILLFAGMYFLLVAPQRAKEKELQKLLKELAKGDEVATIGGVIGTIEKISDERISLRVADKTVIEFQRAAITGKLTPSTSESKK